MSQKIGDNPQPPKIFCVGRSIASAGRRNKFLGVGGYPQFLTQGLGVPPLFTEKSIFRQKPRFRSKSLQKKVNPFIILIPFYFFRSLKHIENRFTFFRGVLLLYRGYPGSFTLEIQMLKFHKIYLISSRAVQQGKLRKN